MLIRGALHLFFLFSLLAAAVPGAGAEPGPGGGDVRAILLRGIEFNFSGDFDRADETFARVAALDPGHPAPDFFAATVLFWRNGLDPNDPGADEAIRALLARAAHKALARARDGGGRIDALHYLGLSYTYLGRLEAQRGRFYAGGTHGEQGRKYLEQALAECSRRGPGEVYAACRDVAFPLGAYAYFAGRLPAFLQKLNFLWFLPRGTTEQGLAELERARRESDLHRLGATALLARIYGLFEAGREGEALEFSSSLAARFPDNPVLNVEHAELLVRAGRTGEASALAAEVLGKVGRGVRNYDGNAARAARLVQAEAAVREGDPDRAGAILDPLQEEMSGQRSALTPKADLLRGMAEDLRGNRERALALYEQAAGHEGRAANRQSSREAKRYIDEPYRAAAPVPSP